MSYCLNPCCPHPENSDQNQFCISCGAKLYLGDRYRILRPLGEKGKGRTFLGVDENTAQKNRCIIKQINYNLDPNNLQKSLLSFEKEALKLQQIGQHPQIPQLFAYFIPQAQQNYGNLPILVQEFILGTPIAQEIFEEQNLIELLAKILPVLHFIHQQNIIHRDINPDNILRRQDNQELVLVDFSTAKVTTKTALAKTGTVIGTAAYTAPEQLRGKAEFSSDIYSLGITCINLLTGMHPFDLFSSMDGIGVWKDYLPQPLNQELIKIINNMIADKISERYGSAEEVLKALVKANLLPPTALDFQQNLSFNTQNSLSPGWKCLKTLNDHSNSIHSLTFSGDGNILVSGGADQTIKIWQGEKYALLNTVKAHQSIIEKVIFTPDQKFLISASWDYLIKIWASKTGEQITQFREHSGWIYDLAISPDGKILVSGGGDKTLKIWELPEGIIKHNIKLVNNYVKSITFSPFGKLFATGNDQGLIQLWSWETGEEKIKFDAHSQGINALCFSPSGQLLLSGGGDHLIKVWNLSTGKLLKTLQGHAGEINAMAINHQGNLLISGGNDQTIMIWHPTQGELLTKLFDHSASIKALAFHPQKMLFASGSQDKTIKIWEYQ